MLSEAYSISSKRRYGWSRVCRLWKIPRSTAYDWQRRQASGKPVKSRGRRPVVSDVEVVEAIKQVLVATTPARFHGEGYRKVWARLRHRGIRTDKERIRRLMGQHQLLAPM